MQNQIRSSNKKLKTKCCRLPFIFAIATVIHYLLLGCQQAGVTGWLRWPRSWSWCPWTCPVWSWAGQLTGRAGGRSYTTSSHTGKLNKLFLLFTVQNCIVSEHKEMTYSNSLQVTTQSIKFDLFFRYSCFEFLVYSILSVLFVVIYCFVFSYFSSFSNPASPKVSSN